MRLTAGGEDGKFTYLELNSSKPILKRAVNKSKQVFLWGKKEDSNHLAAEKGMTMKLILGLLGALSLLLLPQVALTPLSAADAQADTMTAARHLSLIHI